MIGLIKVDATSSDYCSCGFKFIFHVFLRYGYYHSTTAVTTTTTATPTPAIVVVATVALSYYCCFGG